MNYTKSVTWWKGAKLACRLSLLVLAGGATKAIHAMEVDIFTVHERQWILDHPVVRYAVDPHWPMEFVEDGQHKGLTREYIDWVENVSGLHFQLVPSPSWTDTLRSMEAGDIQLSSGVSTQLLSENIHQKILLSVPYFIDTAAAVARSGSPLIYTPAELNGKTVAIKGGGGTKAT